MFPAKTSGRIQLEKKSFPPRHTTPESSRPSAIGWQWQWQWAMAVFIIGKR
jgi:hypothetical protein